MAILFGLISACCYGVSDFVGGLVSRRAPAVTVSFFGQLVGVVVTALALLIRGGHLDTAALGWGALAGVGTGAGTALLYRGLATGRMSVVAPLSGLSAAAIPVVVGALLGDRLGAVATAGIIVALPAVVLVSLQPRSGAAKPARSGVVEGIGSGAAFAVTFVALARAGADAGGWPPFVAAVSAALVLGAACALGRAGFAVPRSAVSAIGLFGLLGAGATISYSVASGHGSLTVIAVLTALYPALTVVAARVILSERWSRLQIVGLLAAAAAAVLIAVG